MPVPTPLRTALAAVTLLSAPFLAQAQSTTALTENWRNADYVYQSASMAADSAHNTYSVGHSLATGTLILKKFAPASATPLWQATYSRPGVYSVITASQVLVGADAGPVVVALVYGSMMLEPSGWLVLKYDTAGTLLWERTIAGSGALEALQAVIDAGNNVIVAGMLSSLTATGYVSGATLAKFSAAGDLLWTKTSPLEDPPGFIHAVIPRALVLSPDGSRLAMAASLDSSRFAARSYDLDGNLLWSTTYFSDPALDRTLIARDVAFGAGNVSYFAAGERPLSGADQMALIKYDAAGNKVWQRTYPVGNDALRVRVDSLGNVVAAGTAPNGARVDWATLKTNANGDLLWWRPHNAHKANDEIPTALALDGNNAVYVSGRSGPALPGLTSNTGTVVKYDAAGAPRWSTWDAGAHGGALVVEPSGTSFTTLGFANLITARFTPTGLLEPLPAAPGTPAASLGTSGVNLSFTDNANNEYWYEIERCINTACSSFQKIGETSGQNDTQFGDAGVLQGYTYVYRARAVGFMGTSAYSPTATIAIPLPAPDNLTGTAVSGTRIDLAWVNNSSSQSGIKIERCKGATCTGFAQIAVTGAGVTTFSNTGLSRKTTYRYRVRAYTPTANSPYSAIVSVTTPR